jgi:hypothetical protein
MRRLAPRPRPKLLAAIERAQLGIAEFIGAD